MRRDEMFQMQTLEQILGTVVKVMLWMIIGLFGLYFTVVNLSYGAETLWTSRGIYWSLTAVVIAPWRLYRNFKDLDQKMDIRAELILPPRVRDVE